MDAQSQTGVGRAVAVVEGHPLVPQLLRREDRGGRRDDRGHVGECGREHDLGRIEPAFGRPDAYFAVPRSPA